MINKKGLVLFIDDEELNRILAEDILESIGYDSILAASGIDALKIYENKQDLIDIVILDFMMPEMDGKATFIELQKINPDIKVILASGYSYNEDIEYMKNNGLSSTINKPYKINDLKELIESVLS